MPNTGRMFLQIPGPTNLPERVQRAMDMALINHRGDEFVDLTKRILPRLKQVFRTERGTPVIFPSSGTGAWESSLVNTLSPGDGVLAITVGEFSGGWGRLAKAHNFNVDVLELPWGSGVTEDVVLAKLNEDKGKKYKAVLTIHNETSTGVTTDVKAVRTALDKAKHPALLMVDTVSGLACTDLRFDEWGVDVAVTGSQKGLLLPPGLGLLCISEKALKAMESAKTPRYYFDWAPMIEKNRAGIFPYTPVTQMMYGLDAALDMLLEEGLDQIFKRHHRLAEGVRRAVKAWGMKTVAIKPQDASNVLTAVYLPEGYNADTLIARTEAELNLALGAGLGPLAGRAFRIGHLGWLNEVEVLATLSGVELGMKLLNVPITLGSGVAAAQQWFLETHGK
jgi:alanine-glyoxylate transaminase / serine-glyoxylate transaminase / serine-pyruvate transaminase